MRQLLRSPRWLGGLAVAIVAALVCAGLGRWQWDRSQAGHGTLQNLAYAFNWWLFAVLCIGVWVKALRDETRHPRSEQPQVAAPRPALGVNQVADDVEVADWNDWLAGLNADPRR